MVKRNEYTERQKTEFVELAKEIGVNRAVRELGYPAGSATGYKWGKDRGIDLPKSTIGMLRMYAAHIYSVEEKMIICTTALDRIQEYIATHPNISPNDHDKLAGAVKKYIEIINLIEGKATSIKETYERDHIDNDILELMNQEALRNQEMERNE